MREQRDAYAASPHDLARSSWSRALPPHRRVGVAASRLGDLRRQVVAEPRGEGLGLEGQHPVALEVAVGVP